MIALDKSKSEPTHISSSRAVELVLAREDMRRVLENIPTTYLGSLWHRAGAYVAAGIPDEAIADYDAAAVAAEFKRREK